MKVNMPEGLKALNLADEAQMEELIRGASDRELAALGDMFEKVHNVVCSYCQLVGEEYARRQRAQPHPDPMEEMARALQELERVLNKPAVDGAFHVPGNDKIH